MNDFVDALLVEIKLRANTKLQIHTVYFGGGTPSLLSLEQLDKIFAALNTSFNLNNAVEIGFELNPENVSANYLRHLSMHGVNRVSMGVQTFNAKALEWMNRSHNAQQAKQAIEVLKASPIKNVSCDLIYALPNQSVAHLGDDITTLMQFEIPHISSYLLTAEEQTLYAKQLKAETIVEANEDTVEKQFFFLAERLATFGLEQYEISNFAKPGWESKHNSNYWQGVPYLGFGPAAHSFCDMQREWNIANNAQYIKSLVAGKRLFDAERLTKVDRYNELVFTQLRLKNGLDMQQLKIISGFDLKLLFQKELMRNKDKGFIDLLKENLVLTQKGKLFADAVASDFFLSNDDYNRHTT